MLPYDIFAYKMKWKPKAIIVDLHSDLKNDAVEWCKKRLKQWEWDMKEYTYVYSHTFYFKKEEDAESFRTVYRDWINKGKQ